MLEGKVVKNKIFTRKKIGEHFNQRGHTIEDLTVILEKVKTMDTEYRKEREKYLIRKFIYFMRPHKTPFVSVSNTLLPLYKYLVA